MDQITIKELYKKLQKQIDAADDIDVFYIGKAKDVQKRAKEHQEQDRLPFTITLASGSETSILKGEKYLQSKLLNDNRCLNKQKGGGPEVEHTDSLYFSYRKKTTNLYKIFEIISQFR